MRPLLPLPVDEVIGEVRRALIDHGCVVLHAPTGAGKTTRIPPALLDMGRVVVLEPRRIAARAAARRMADERGESVGGTVGFQVRFERKISKHTRLEVLTEGVLLRRLVSDPFLDNVDVVVFDEFHERSIEVDLCLALVRQVQLQIRPELKIVVMSATLAGEPVAAWLGDCPLVRCEGRLHPVDIRYDTRLSPHSAVDRVPQAVTRALRDTTGSVLVFLPGAGPIRRALSETAAVAPGDVSLLPLYGSLSPKEQDRALKPEQGIRKVVFATNVAETSVTIPDVTAVVDTGTARIPRRDPNTGLNRLDIEPICRASADQRAGRAGRVAPGVCYRLWTRREHQGRREHESPDVSRIDLTSAVLQLLAWGEPDPTAFPWFEAPPEGAVADALTLLHDLGALHEGRLTPVGEQLANMPAHPRLARAVLEGAHLGVTGEVATAAALIESRSPFHPMDLPPEAPFSDVHDMVDALDAFARRRPHPSRVRSPGAAKRVIEAANQLRRSVDIRGHRGTSVDQAITLALLAGYPDRVAAVRDNVASQRARMVGGAGVKLAKNSAARGSRAWLCIDVEAGREEALVRVAVGIDPDDLPAEVRLTAVLDRTSGRLVGVEQRVYRDLVLHEQRGVKVPDPVFEQALLELAEKRIATAAPMKDLAPLLNRLRTLAHWRPDLAVPFTTDQDLASLLPRLVRKKRSLAEVKEGNWTSAIMDALTWPQRQGLDTEAPERLSLPKGRHARITYPSTPGERPVIEARIQHFFGVTKTPTLGRDNHPVLIHLLAPNGRATQVTDDLAGFWERTYPEVRKELRARYPKHAWPENPTPG